MMRAERVRRQVRRDVVPRGVDLRGAGQVVDDVGLGKGDRGVDRVAVEDVDAVPLKARIRDRIGRDRFCSSARSNRGRTCRRSLRPTSSCW